MSKLVVITDAFGRYKTFVLGFFQTCIKRIRLDMPITAEDFTGNRDEGSGNEDNAAGGSSDAVR